MQARGGTQRTGQPGDGDGDGDDDDSSSIRDNYRVLVLCYVFSDHPLTTQGREYDPIV